MTITTKAWLRCGIAASLLVAQQAEAQTSPPSQAPAQTPAETAAPDAAQDGLGDIVVTASKRADAQNVQDVPFAVTAFGTAQLEEQHVRSIQGISFSVPNASLESVGTTPGYANFSIRGLGINSSIPSIDPTVGVFVDGIYLGSARACCSTRSTWRASRCCAGHRACCSGAT